MMLSNNQKFSIFRPILVLAILLMAVCVQTPVKAGIPDPPPYTNVVLSSICGPKDVWTKPGAPTLLSARPDLGNPSGKIALQWTDNSSNETGFTIERSDNPDDDFFAVGYAPAHTGPGQVSFLDQSDVSPATTYYYRVLATGGGNTESEPCQVASATTADAPFFSETWNAVTGPYYPGSSYISDSSGSIDGADRSGWQWSTAGSNANGVSFRENGSGYEFGRFNPDDSGAFSASAPMEPVDFSQDQALYAQFDVTVDPAGSGSGHRQTLALRSESDYNSGGSGIELWIDGSSDAPAFGAQVYNNGESSTPFCTSLGQISGNASKHYRVQTELICNGSDTVLRYQLLDGAGLVMTSGTSVLNLNIDCEFRRAECVWDENSRSGIDNVSLAKICSLHKKYIVRNENEDVQSPSMYDYIDKSMYHLLPFTGKEVLPNGKNNALPYLDTTTYEGNAIPLIVGQSITFQVIAMWNGEQIPVPRPEQLHPGYRQFVWIIPSFTEGIDYTISFKDPIQRDIATITFLKSINGTIDVGNEYHDGEYHIGNSYDSVDFCVMPTGDCFNVIPYLKAEWKEDPSNTDPYSHKGYIEVSSINTHLEYNWTTDLKGIYTEPVSQVTNATKPGNWQKFDSAKSGDNLITLYPGQEQRTFYAELQAPDLKQSKRINIHVQVDPVNSCKKILTTDPVDLYTGAKHEAENDLVVPNDGLDFIFGRQYNSQSDGKSILGYNWETNWCQRFTMQDSDADGIADALQDLTKTPAPIGPDPDGGYTFRLTAQNGDGITRYNSGMTKSMINPALSLHHYSGQTIETYEYPKAVTGLSKLSDLEDIYVAPPGNYGKLKITESSGVCKIKLYQPSGNIETYYGFDKDTNTKTDGKLLSVEDREGRKITLEYDSSGRLIDFKLGADTDPKQTVTLEYWGDSVPPTAKDGLLKSISYLDRKVEYDYDFKATDGLIKTDGDLTSVKINGTRETRYEYYQQSHYIYHIADRTPLMHNLTKIFRPQEVAKNPSDPQPYKEIFYFDDPTNTYFDRVREEILYGEGIINGSHQYYSYYPVTGDTGIGLNKAVNMTRHIEGDFGAPQFKSTDYYFNSMGLNVKTVRTNLSGGGDLCSTTEYDGEGRVLNHTDERGAMGSSQIYQRYTDLANDFNHFRGQHTNVPNTDDMKAKYLAFMRRFDGCVASSSLDCQCAGAGTEPVTTSFQYDPVTGAVREKTVTPLTESDPGRVWTTYFDYMEAPYSTTADKELLHNRLAVLMGITLDGTPPSGDDRKLVEALLVEFNITPLMNQTDLNGDGQQTPVTPKNKVFGNVVQEKAPDVTLNPSSFQLVAEGISPQQHIRKYQYSADGKHLTRIIDEEGNITDFTYYAAGDTGGPAGYIETKSVYADSSIHSDWNYTYNAYGNLLTQTDPRGIVTQCDYNNFGELTSLIRDALDVPPPGSARMPGEQNINQLSPFPPLAFKYTTNFAYDANGQLTQTSVEDRGPNQMGSRSIDTNYQYDMMGRLAAVVQPSGGLTDNQAIGFAPLPTPTPATLPTPTPRPGAASLHSVYKSAPLTTAFYYDMLGRLALKVYPAGNADYFEYDEFDRLTKSTRGIPSLSEDQKKKICNLPENALAHLGDRGGAPVVVTYSYDASGQLQSTDGDGNGYVSYYYDHFGRLVNRVVPIDASRKRADYWIYDAYGNLKDEISGKYLNHSDPGAITSGNFADYIDIAHNPYQYTDYVYDELNRPVQVNRLVKLDTDSLLSGRVPAQDVSSWRYGADTKPDTTNKWLATRMEYDKAGRLTHLVSDDGSYVKYQYNGFDLPTRVENYPYKYGTGTYDAGFVENTYDLCGNLIESDRTVKSTDGADNKQYRNTYFYDALGRLTTAIDNLNQATDYRYNSRDLLTAVADANSPDAAARSYQRRSVAGGSGHCNDYGNVTAFYYDPLGRKVLDRQILTATHKGDGKHMGEPRIAGRLFIIPWPDASYPPNPAGQGGGDGLIDTSYEYDSNGMLSSLTDDNGNVSVWGYDAQNRAVLEQKGNPIDVHQSNQADGLKAAWSVDTYLERIFDAKGRLQTVTREDGTVLTYGYPTACGPVSQVSASGPGAAAGANQQTFAYDALGRMTQAIDQRSGGSAIAPVTAKWSYDSLGRAVEESQQIGTSAAPVRIVSTARTSDHPTKLYYSSNGTGTAATSLLDLDSFGGGALQSVKLTGVSGSAIAQYEYLGGVRSRAMKNGVTLDMGTGSGLQFDELGRPKQYAHMDGSTVRAGFDYHYDAAGNIAKLQRLTSRTSAADPQDYTYDSASRLTALSRPGAGAGLMKNAAWELDGLGNWNSVTTTKADGTTTIKVRKDDAWNATTSEKIGSADPQYLTYDANGNLTADGQRQFVWDAFGRLAQVKDAAGALVAAYRYDALGRRVRKDLYDTSGAIDKVIDEVWDGWRLIEEYEANSATATPSLARWFAYGNGIDEPLMMHVKGDIPAHDCDYYYHQDALGSVAALTDSTGAVAESYEYDPYGTHVLIVPATPTPTRTPNAASTLGNPFLYAGRQFDAESGLYYNRHRYYDPALGRFISTDPIGFLGGFNLYEYVNSSPIQYIDPLGLDGIDPPSFGRRGGLFAHPAINIGLTHGDEIAVGVVVTGAKLTRDYVREHPLKAAANVASFFLDPVDWANSAVDIKDDVKSGHYIAAGVTTLGALIPIVTGKIGKLSEGIGEGANDLTKAGRTAERESCTLTHAGVSLKDAANDLSKAERNLDEEAEYLFGPIAELRSAGAKDAHHIAQDAAVRDIPGYDTEAAIGVQLPGPPSTPGTPHNLAGRVQRQAGGGNLAAELRIGYKALRRAGVSEKNARILTEQAYLYFRSIGATLSTLTRIPGNRKIK